MKLIMWIKENQNIPDGSIYLNEKRETVTEWGSDHPLLDDHVVKSYMEYLYEIPVEDDK